MDNSQKEKTLLKYAHLVKYVVNRMLVNIPPCLEKEDLISAGTIGLLEAIEKYNSQKGVNFETYALHRIKGAILDELRSMNWAPRTTQEKARDLERAYRNLEQKLGRMATDEEMAEEMGITMEEFYRRLDEARGISPLSLEQFQYSPNGGVGMNLLDSLRSNSPSPLTDTERGEIKEILTNVLSSLPEKERIVITLYYYEGLTLKEIGKVLHLTESRVCQIHTKVIIKLRTRLRRIFEPIEKI
jgi:RNA polymerase sigma factor for flagellar operon FliA